MYKRYIVSKVKEFLVFIVLNILVLVVRGNKYVEVKVEEGIGLSRFRFMSFVILSVVIFEVCVV